MNARTDECLAGVDHLAKGLPRDHDTPTARHDIDVHQLVADFQQLDPYGRRMVLAMVAAALRLKGGSA